MWNNPDPIIRSTYRANLQMYLLAAPSFAMIRYAPFLAVKTYNAEAWVPVLAAIVPASHLLAAFVSGAISRSPEKTVWVVRPMMISNLVFLLLLFVNPAMGWMFALVIILAQSMRAPIVAAQAAIFRTNYPPAARSFSMSVPMAGQFLMLGIFSKIIGPIFDHSEGLVVPSFLVAAGLGIAAAWSFRKVKTRPAESPEPAAAIERTSFLDQFRKQIEILRTNRGFFHYELAYLFFGSGFVAIAATFPLYLNEEFNTSHTEATMAITTVPMLATAITLPLWGKLLDRFNPLLMRSIINGIWSFTPLLLFFAPRIEAVYLAQLLQGLVWSGSMLIWWLGVNYFARKEEVAIYMTIHQTLTGLRGIITPFIGIQIAQIYGYRFSMLFWYVLMLIGFLIMVVEVMRERKKGTLHSFAQAEAIRDAQAAPAATKLR